MKKRSQQRWLVTGASSGFGREIVRAVVASGGQVMATARHLPSLADLIAGSDGRCLAQSLDVTDAGQVAAAVQAAEAQLGGIDVLVNNAGYGMLDGVEEADEAAIRRVFEVNFFGAVNLIRAVLPGLRSRRRGWIVNISSSGGRLSAPSLGYYSASKHAIEGLSKALRGEVGPLGIGVTVIEPGSFRTAFAGRSMVTGTVGNTEYRDSVGAIIDRVRANAGREPGDPEKAANAIVAALDADEPPHQLLLGADAVMGVAAVLRQEQTELERWREISLATGHTH